MWYVNEMKLARQAATTITVVGLLGTLYCTWLAIAPASSITSAQRVSYNTPLAGVVSGGTAFPLVSWASNAANCTSSPNNGPNSIPYSVCSIPFTSVGDSVMTQFKAPPTWSAVNGSVDVTVVLYQNTGFPFGGSWAFSFYIGCATSANSTFTYGTAALDISTPPNQGTYEVYIGQGLHVTNQCAAENPVQVWVQRNADQGGASGLTPQGVSLEAVFR